MFPKHSEYADSGNSKFCLTESVCIDKQDLRISQTEILELRDTIPAFQYSADHRVANGTRVQCDTEKRLHDGTTLSSNSLRFVEYRSSWDAGRSIRGTCNLSA
jgi:hypothetical protein